MFDTFTEDLRPFLQSNLIYFLPITNISTIKGGPNLAAASLAIVPITPLN
jgi:hypothetical protein